MGGAVYAALDGEYTFARAPLAAVASTQRDANIDSQSNIPRKTDRILTEADTISSHQVLRISTVTKSGDRDVIKVKPYARVLATLSLSPGDRSADVPPFNPLSIFEQANNEQPQEGPAVDDEGEVTVVTRDLANVPVDDATSLTMPIEQLLGLVNELSFEASAKTVTIPMPLLDKLGEDGKEGSVPSLSYTDLNAGAGSSIYVNVFNENETTIGKSAATATGSGQEQTIVVQEKETLKTILSKLGATAEDSKAIEAALGDAAELNEGQRLRVLVEPVADENGQGRPVRLSVFNADKHVGTVALSDNGDYVTVADPEATDLASADQGQDEENDVGGMRLYSSIYETALKQDVQKPMIEDLLRIYAYDVDLSRRTRPGDNFELFYEQDESGAPVGDILYTALSVDGELKRYYRFVSPDDGQVDYYDEQGRSARKFLMRKPVNGGVMRSTFGMRRHPILGYYKMHTGVDWAGVPVGTPILATGNGTISKAGWTNGYGRHIEIQHANGYLTTYSHMSGFARGMEAGVKVKLGQVIGYLGSTGLSTGPHIHYEVKINDNFVDPMRIKLPQGRELSGALLANFKLERDKIDAMMTKAPVAQASTVSAIKG